MNVEILICCCWKKQMPGDIFLSLCASAGSPSSALWPRSSGRKRRSTAHTSRVSGREGDLTPTSMNPGGTSEGSGASEDRRRSLPAWQKPAGRKRQEGMLFHIIWTLFFDFLKTTLFYCSKYKKSDDIAWPLSAAYLSFIYRQFEMSFSSKIAFSLSNHTLTNHTHKLTLAHRVITYSAECTTSQANNSSFSSFAWVPHK